MPFTVRQCWNLCIEHNKGVLTGDPTKISDKNNVFSDPYLVLSALE